MRLSSLCRVAAACAAIAAIGTGLAAMAQVPTPIYPPPPSVVGPPVVPPPAVAVPAAPASPEAADIAACLCLRQAVDTLGAQMGGGRQAYDQTLAELSRLDSQLAQERAAMDVNNPASVARFRQLLQERDAVYRRSSGAMLTDLSAVVARYNARVSEYNTRCADRPRNPVLVASVQATLSCPPP
jgi:hypothetical protein